MDEYIKNHADQISSLQRYQGRGDAPSFALKGFMLAKIVGVYDGDTCHAVIPTPFQMDFEFRIRLLNYDAEEIKQPKSDPDRLEKIAIATSQRDALTKFIGGKIVLIDAKGFDAFGRILAIIWTLNETLTAVDTEINSKMIEICKN